MVCFSLQLAGIMFDPCSMLTLFHALQPILAYMGGAGGFRAPFPVGLAVACAFMAAATAAAICSSRLRCRTFRSSSASCWRAARLASQPCRMSWSQGRLMVARRCNFRSSTSRMVYMSSRFPTLSLMLRDAGASLVGQLAVVGATGGSTLLPVRIPLPRAPPLRRGWWLWGRGCDQPQGAQVHFRGEQVLAGLQVLLVVRTGTGEQARIDLIQIAATAHDGAQVLPILGQADGALCASSRPWRMRSIRTLT